MLLNRARREVGAAPPGPDERRRALDLVRAHGADALSFFKLRSDSRYLFAADGQSLVAYRVRNGVLLLAGDPVGPAAALPGLLREVDELARDHGLRVGVLGASPRLVEPARAIGLRALYIGDDAIVELDRFSLEGRPMRKVRQSVARAQRSGYAASAQALGDLDAGAVDELEALTARWRAGAPERGFSMTMDSLDGGHQAEAIVVVARDAGGRARGFVHCVPCYGRPAMAVSVVPRDRDTPNGLTEFLIARTVETLRERGVRELSLYFAAFARLLREPHGTRDRLLGRLVALGSLGLQMESLYRFDKKFASRWEPRYLLYPGRLGLARTGLAAMRAEGQLPPPRLRRARR
jgi:lysyl-tRNA synthetase, class II